MISETSASGERSAVCAAAASGTRQQNDAHQCRRYISRNPGHTSSIVIRVVYGGCQRGSLFCTVRRHTLASHLITSAFILWDVPTAHASPCLASAIPSTDRLRSSNTATPYELLVAVILSAQCTDERVNKTTPALFEAFSCTVGDMAQADAEDIYPVY